MKQPRPQVAEVLRSAFPGLMPGNVEFLGEGDFCSAFLLENRLVVRIAKHDAAARALQREACVLPIIASRLPVTVPIPTTRVVRTSDADAVRISVHSHVAGVALNAEEWQALPPAVYSALARQLGEFLSALHAIPIDSVSACEIPRVDHQAEAVRLRSDLENAGGMSQTLKSALESALSSYIAGGSRWSYQPAILNADVSPEHVLVDRAGSRIAGVIDWGDVCTGDPARDFIFLYEDWESPFLRDVIDACATREPEAFRRRVLQHYLMDQLAWMLSAQRGGSFENFDDGVRALEEVVIALSSEDDGHA